MDIGVPASQDANLNSLYSRYARLIFDEELEPKVVQRRAITAPELMTYFEVYVKMFQSGSKSFPKVQIYIIF